MKTSLDHLTQEKRDELEALVRITRERFPREVEMIILFGSYARGDYVEELAPDGFHYTYQSDFDIMVIVGTKQCAHQYHRWEKLEDRFWRSPGVRTPVTLLYHQIDYINDRLAHGQYFYADVVKEGILLFDSQRHELANARKLRPDEFKKQAEAYFDYWFGNAVEFVEGHEFFLAKGRHNLAAFHLHQAVERLYSSVLLVMTLYKPKGHDIEKLGRHAAGHDPKLLEAFPKGTSEEKRLFELLRSAYVDARYDPEYKITADELEWLAKRVDVLKELTENICRRKIESLGS